jgi:hypothetical protein
LSEYPAESGCGKTFFAARLCNRLTLEHCRTFRGKGATAFFCGMSLAANTAMKPFELLLAIGLVALPLPRVALAQGGESGSSSPAIESECNQRYNTLVLEAKDALIKGDRTHSIELLGRAKLLLESCADLEDRQADSHSESACNSFNMPESLHTSARLDRPSLTAVHEAHHLWPFAVVDSL